MLPRTKLVVASAGAALALSTGAGIASAQPDVEAIVNSTCTYDAGDEGAERPKSSCRQRAQHKPVGVWVAAGADRRPAGSASGHDRASSGLPFASALPSGDLPDRQYVPELLAPRTLRHRSAPTQVAGSPDPALASADYVGGGVGGGGGGGRRSRSTSCLARFGDAACDGLGFCCRVGGRSNGSLAFRDSAGQARRRDDHARVGGGCGGCFAGCEATEHPRQGRRSEHGCGQRSLGE